MEINLKLHNAVDNSEQLTLQPKILRLSLKRKKRVLTYDKYVPSNARVKGVLLSGIMASTSVAARGDRVPFLIRLIDKAHLPKGFKNNIKDAWMSGGCYGSLASERAVCRVEQLTYVDDKGVIYEKTVQARVFGEDAQIGLRGTVFDNQAKIMRESIMASMLQGFSEFVKSLAESKALPSNALGQVNALNPTTKLIGGAANGFENSINNITNTYLKKIDSISPEIQVDAGRLVDVVFYKGFFVKDMHDNPQNRSTSNMSKKLPQQNKL